MPSTARLSSIASASLALPSLARCERPRQARSSAASDQPGRFAQGPEEKWGMRGRRLGRACAVMAPFLPEWPEPVGRFWPAADTTDRSESVQPDLRTAATCHDAAASLGECSGWTPRDRSYYVPRTKQREGRA